MRISLLAVLLCAGLVASAHADGPPPEGFLPLSGIVAELEQRPDFAYVEEIELDDGYWEVEYRTRDGRERKIEIDPLTGEERARR